MPGLSDIGVFSAAHPKIVRSYRHILEPLILNPKTLRTLRKIQTPIVYREFQASRVTRGSPDGVECRVQGLGFRALGLGFRIQGLGFRVQGLGFRDQGLGGVKGSWSFLFVPSFCPHFCLFFKIISANIMGILPLQVYTICVFRPVCFRRYLLLLQFGSKRVHFVSPTVW